MCARRFLMVIFVLTLLVVAGAFAVFQYGSEVLVKQALPSVPFEAPKNDTGPDYVRVENWLNLPDTVPPGPADWSPQGATPDRLLGREAATFYIHPTTYLEKDRWNAPLGDKESQDRAALFVRSQASAFQFSRVYAPKYRQAAFGAFLDTGKDAQGALNLAYQDVGKAFDRFLVQEPKGPIILVGHSQGALHLTRLLRERVAKDPALAKRVVAAYVVGWPVSKAADVPAMGLPACERRGQPGCILSWMSFGEPANIDPFVHVYDGTTGFTGGKRQRGDLLCVNPITGDQAGKATSSANAGTLVPTDDTLADATLEKGLVGAECRGGFLSLSFADDKPPALGPYVLPGNNYHVYDIALFWADIRRDAEERLAAWR
ncbi:DUF3089 domain-containing protein [Sphingomonas rosea]|uniref:DUF3089 domain-containing protein n=1 Tax=Sphingomonas rosea TaxID=335605 RepID=A0ABP7UB23_9SPHN